MLVITLLAESFGSGATGRTVTEMLIRLVFVVGLYVFVGNSGVISFGHAGFMCIGAYVAAWLTVPPAMKQFTMPGLPDALAQAELSLPYSDVQATEAGVVSNLQVQPGAYATAGMAMAALVTDQTDVVADFREKSLAHVEPGTAAAIVFDARPGEVFAAHVAGVDAGTRAGQMAADGTLASPQATDRWVRDAQRQRLHLKLDNPPSMLSGLPSGARATVQLLPGGGVADWLGWLQIHAISLVHYIY